MPTKNTANDRPDTGTRVMARARADTTALYRQGSKRPMKQNVGALSPVMVTEYDHFISFSLENYEGQQIFVQYRRDQVWRDADGVWQVKEGQRPFYASGSTAPQQFEAKLCPDILLAFRATLATSG